MADRIPERTQLDRIETGINEIKLELARLEERLNHQGVKIETHDMALTDQGKRLRELELNHAVTVATSSEQGKRLIGRWAAIGAVALVLLSSIGAATGKFITDMLNQQTAEIEKRDEREGTDHGVD